VRKSILNLRSTKPQPPRFCDVIIDGDDVILEVKTDRDRIETINWDDLEYQVQVAKKIAANNSVKKLPQVAP